MAPIPTGPYGIAKRHEQYLTLQDEKAPAVVLPPTGQPGEQEWHVESLSNGNVTIKNKGASEEQGQQSNGGARSGGGAARRGGDGSDGAVGYDGDQFRKRSMKHFPVPKTDVDRPIIRQNSLTQANALFATLAKEGFYGQVDQVFNSAKEAAAEVIELASLFEAYSSGETN